MTTVNNLRKKLSEEFQFDAHLSTPTEFASSWNDYKSIFCSPATAPNSWLVKAHREWERGNKTIVVIIAEKIKESKVYKTIVVGCAETRHIETEIVYSQSKCVRSYIIVVFKMKPPPVKSFLITFND